MAQDILQRFLTARLFNLAGDDARLQKLKDAADDVAALLKAAPQRTASFVLVACDQRVPADEPVLTDVAALVEKKWNSYLSAFPENALPVVIRAVILDGLARALGQDAIALATCLTARSILPHLGSPGDAELWRDLIEEASRRLEHRAQKEWAVPSTVALGDFNLSLPEAPTISANTVKEDWLTGLFVAASGPHDANSKAYPSANSQWPNNGPAWSYEFAPLAAKAVAAAVDASAKANIGKINEYLQAQEPLKAFSEQIGIAISSFLQKANGLERRTNMVWWKEALYSPEAGASYRTFELAEACAWVAADAINIAGPYAPRMAEAVISETLREIFGSIAAEPVSLSILCSGAVIRESGADDKLLAQFGGVYQSPGRSQLASLLREENPADYLQARLGLSRETKVSPIEFTLWIYRDLQIARATVASSRPRRKAS